MSSNQQEPDPAAITDDPRYHWKAGAVFEPELPRQSWNPPVAMTHTCESPFTSASIIPHQYEHLAEENRRLKESAIAAEQRATIAWNDSETLRWEIERLTARVRELEAENATLRGKVCYESTRGCMMDDAVKAYCEGAD